MHSLCFLARSTSCGTTHTCMDSTASTCLLGRWTALLQPRHSQGVNTPEPPRTQCRQSFQRETSRGWEGRARPAPESLALGPQPDRARAAGQQGQVSRRSDPSVEDFLASTIPENSQRYSKVTDITVLITIFRKRRKAVRISRLSPAVALCFSTPTLKTTPRQGSAATPAKQPR